ncbi:UV-stimulated scaffold protein A isoform X3 [Stigmatopora nigra]
MELSQRDRLSELVEELTTSGQQQISREKMKEIKKICKESIDGINHVYHSIMSRLNKDHAEIRLAAFNLATEIFPKSHHFRTVLLDNFQEFLELTVEINFERPLPPPLPVSRKLQSLAIQTIQSWHSFYGSAYKRLELGYQFLKQFKKVEIEDAQARAEEERVREAESQKNMKRTHKERLEAVIKDMEGFHVEETDDNEAVISTLIDLQRLLITKHLPAVRYWVQIFTRSGGELDFLTRALELKRSLESSSQKFSQLNIKFKSGIKKMILFSWEVRSHSIDTKHSHIHHMANQMAASFEDEEDDTDFIEVSEKEGNGSHIPLSLQVKNVPIPWTDCSTRSKVSVMRPRGSSKRRAR